MSTRVDCRVSSFEKRVEFPLTPTSGASLNSAECVSPKGPKSFILNEKIDDVVPKAPRAHLHLTPALIDDSELPPPISLRTASSDTDTRPKPLIINKHPPKGPKALEMDINAPKAPKALLAVASTRKQRVIERTYLEMQRHPFVLTPCMKVREDKSIKSNEPTMKKCRVNPSMALFFPDRRYDGLSESPSTITRPHHDIETDPVQSSHSPSPPQIIASLTNEFWELQDKMSGLEEKLVQLCRDLEQHHHSESSSSDSSKSNSISTPKSFCPDRQICGLPENAGEELESIDPLYYSATSNLNTLRLERKRIEWILEDVQRECRNPLIVPALLETITIKARYGEQEADNFNGLPGLTR